MTALSSASTPSISCQRCLRQVWMSVSEMDIYLLYHCTSHSQFFICLFVGKNVFANVGWTCRQAWWWFLWSPSLLTSHSSLTQVVVCMTLLQNQVHPCPCSSYNVFFSFLSSFLHFFPLTLHVCVCVCVPPLSLFCIVYFNTFFLLLH